MQEFRYRIWALVALLVSVSALTLAGPDGSSAPNGGSRWGADYFPNVPLVTHEGKSVRFFDDLIKDKVVVINFIYTTCPDVCPLETARLAEMQAILGDRVGRDVFMYSITIDPATDTPEVLKEYAERYQVAPGWLFLTGMEADIKLLRKKLGLYIDEIQGVQEDGTRDHNLSMIIGNQATGRWMKRSPFENPYVLAKHVGSWLHNWKAPSQQNNDFANAPKLRNLFNGETLFRTRCAACHGIGPSELPRVGPDLLGVTERRDPEWLARWLAAPDQLLAEKDPLAMELYERHKKVSMPNMELTEKDVAALMDYMATESRRVRRTQKNRAAGVGLVKDSEIPQSCCQKDQSLMVIQTPEVGGGERAEQQSPPGSLSAAPIVFSGGLGLGLLFLAALLRWPEALDTQKKAG